MKGGLQTVLYYSIIAMLGGAFLCYLSAYGKVDKYSREKASAIKADQQNAEKYSESANFKQQSELIRRVIFFGNIALGIGIGLFVPWLRSDGRKRLSLLLLLFLLAVGVRILV